MIHYHGTPITPRHKLLGMKGRHFCVSYANPQDIDAVMQIGQSVMLDNGAFSAFTKGRDIDEDGLYSWIEEYLCHPHWAVVPDVIGGTVEQQRVKLKKWTYPKDLSAPVWHLHLSFDWLLELADNFPKVCIGSSGDYWQIGTKKWEQRMDMTFEFLSQHRCFLPWIHGMRMLGQAGNRWPLASADSTNIARNHSQTIWHPEEMAERIDAVQTPRRYKASNQMDLID